MRYETMGRNRTQRLNIPQLLGGLNTATDAALIEDDELSAVCNLTFDHGALVTREAMRAVGDAPFLVEGDIRYLENNILSRQLIEIDGVMCAVMLVVVKPTKAVIKVMTIDGVCLKTYNTPFSATVIYNFAIAPADNDTHGAYFAVYHNGKVYIPNDESGMIEQIDGDKLYAPLVMINGTSILAGDDVVPSASLANGVKYEGFNCLTNRYRAQFTPCGGENDTPEYYCLPTRLETNSGVVMDVVTPKGEKKVELTVGGAEVKFTIGSDYKAQAFSDGYIKVSRALPTSDTSGTVTITCERPEFISFDEENKQETAETAGASEAIWFGGTQNKYGGTRLFLANRAKSKLMWSDVGKPFYFPENNYMIVGDPSQKITALEKQGDMLVIFKEREIYYTTYVQGEVNADAIAEGEEITALQAYFPLTQLSPRIGCRCPQSIALCRDRLVWMDSDARLYTLVVSGAYSERNVREIGAKVRPFLLDNTDEAQRKNASAMDHKGKYRLMIGNRMVEFDYNDSGFVNVSSYYSGERAARNIAWMAHEYSFGDNAVQTLVSDGADKALIISTVSGETDFALVSYVFENESTQDRYLIRGEDGTFQASEHPITVSLTTKTYEFGDPVAYKRIEAFYPMMQAEDAKLYFIADDQTPPYGKAYRSEDLHAHLVLPCVHRCRTFGVRMDAKGKVCIKGLRMQYSMFGNVK